MNNVVLFIIEIESNRNKSDFRFVFNHLCEIQSSAFFCHVCIYFYCFIVNKLKQHIKAAYVLNSFNLKRLEID
jgi:hypothetical protein